MTRIHGRDNTANNAPGSMDSVCKMKRIAFFEFRLSYLAWQKNIGVDIQIIGEQALHRTIVELGCDTALAFLPRITNSVYKLPTVPFYDLHPNIESLCVHCDGIHSIANHRIG